MVTIERSQLADGATCLSVEGELDILTAPRLVGELDLVLRQASGDVVIDLRPTRFIDSSALSVLLNGQRRLTREGRRLRVVTDAGSPVRATIELARLAQTLNVEVD
jgi:anti-sigma B factor antagonist